MREGNLQLQPLAHYKDARNLLLFAEYKLLLVYLQTFSKKAYPRTILGTLLYQIFSFVNVYKSLFVLKIFAKVQKKNYVTKKKLKKNYIFAPLIQIYKHNEDKINFRTFVIDDNDFL